MGKAKSCDHYLLNFILTQLDYIQPDDELMSFMEKHELPLKKFKGTTESILINSLNYWVKAMEKVIQSIENMVNDGVICDTVDSQLKTAIHTWKNTQGLWISIN